jgi:hypothetical protein
MESVSIPVRSLQSPTAGRVCIPTTTAAKQPHETLVEFDDPVLLIAKGRAQDLYTVNEFPTGWDGRAFQLTKDDGIGTVYDVFVSRNGQDDRCDCTGNLQHGRCKHVDSLRALIEAGRLEDPRAAAPVEPFPSPEQLAAEAGVDMPF